MLSVVVIGKNEEENIPRTIESLKYLRGKAQFPVEYLFVDSASTDHSVDIARSFFDNVYTLEASDYLCASAGRYIGSLKAQYQWILYLDGDMELCPEFIDYLCDNLCSYNINTGIIGRYIFHYNDNTFQDKTSSKYRHNQHVGFFGGAILLHKEAVLNAGNWNPSIFSNEEIDLYTRLRAKTYRVIFIDLPMIRHYTRKESYLAILSNLFRKSKAGKKYYGFGQILHARIRNGDIYDFIKYNHYPFVYFFVLIVSIILLFSFISLSIFIFGFALVYISIFKGYKYIIIYTSYILSILYGWNKYNNKFKPRVIYIE